MSDGLLDVELTGAGVVDTMNRAIKKGIILYGVNQTGDLSVRMQISVSDYFVLNKLAAKQGDELVIFGRRGPRFWAIKIMKRPVVLVALMVLLCLSVWLPGRVLFVAVEGNEQLSSQLIMQTAEECGIYFGAKRVVVRSEKVKNKLLQKLPQLQWAGVNTVGCTAVISVVEDVPKKGSGSNLPASSIVARCDGVILSVTATSGASKCKVGDAVTEGQVLISGRSEEGVLYKYTRAKGEIMAQTSRTYTVISPGSYINRGAIVDRERKLSLLIGKKRIKLSKDSGIYYDGYDRIYMEYCVVLPGGFSLPLALAVEEYTMHEQSKALMQDARTIAAETADRYALSQMICGSILSRSVQQEEGSDIYKLFVDYLCTEMIGVERNEELEFINGENYRTDRER